MNNSPYQILLTNDDGIKSPGLWAAAEALSCLGYVTVAAPRDQWSGAGRSHAAHNDGRIHPQTLNVHGKEWTVYGVGGTPAQTIIYGVLEICPRKPDLVVSGINYGENVGTGTTVSGTVGAALEAAALGIPALAISLQTPSSYNFTYSKDIDFSTAAHFVTVFAKKLLSQTMPEDVDILKVEVPGNATKDTPWKVTRVGHNLYYHVALGKREHLEDPSSIKYEIHYEGEKLDPESDVFVLRESQLVSVTPLSIDLTSRVDRSGLDALLRANDSPDLNACKPE